MQFTQVLVIPTGDDFIVFCTCELFLLILIYSNVAVWKIATNTLVKKNCFYHNQKISPVDIIPHIICRPFWLF